MKLLLASITVAAGLLAPLVGFAQAPAGAPAGSTGLCKDGSYTSATEKKGSCKGHKGVKDWYAAATAAPAAAPAPAAASAPTATPAAAPAAPAAAAKTAKAAAPATAAAPGGGPGQVWVNTSSKVYHCQGSKYYGKTKQGEYMTEAAAKAAGDHPNHGKSCS